ncbi:MAG: hypothetical protein M9894_06330 [Planctomycetes bacterium]|nr:hypothetical protein [Planctomycetota bacterium]
MALDLTRSDLARGAVRATASSAALAALALAGMHPLGPATALHVGLLALPATLAEAWFSQRRPGRRACLLALPAVWVVALVAVLLAHAQVVYSSGVLEEGTLRGGLTAVEAEWVLLGRRIEYGFIGLHFLVGSSAGLALPIAAACLARPLAAAGREGPPFVGRVVAAWVQLQALALAVATVVVSQFVAATGPFDVTLGLQPDFWVLVLVYVGSAGLAATLVVPAAWLLGDALVSDASLPRKTPEP